MISETIIFWHNMPLLHTSLWAHAAFVFRKVFFFTKSCQKHCKSCQKRVAPIKSLRKNCNRFCNRPTYLRKEVWIVFVPTGKNCWWMCKAMESSAILRLTKNESNSPLKLLDRLTLWIGHSCWNSSWALCQMAWICFCKEFQKFQPCTTYQPRRQTSRRNSWWGMWQFKRERGIVLKVFKLITLQFTTYGLMIMAALLVFICIYMPHIKVHKMQVRTCNSNLGKASSKSFVTGQQPCSSSTCREALGKTWLLLTWRNCNLFPVPEYRQWQRIASLLV